MRETTKLKKGGVLIKDSLELPVSNTNIAIACSELLIEFLNKEKPESIKREQVDAIKDHIKKFCEDSSHTVGEIAVATIIQAFKEWIPEALAAIDATPVDKAAGQA